MNIFGIIKHSNNNALSLEIKKTRDRDRDLEMKFPKYQRYRLYQQREKRIT